MRTFHALAVLATAFDVHPALGQLPDKCPVVTLPAGITGGGDDSLDGALMQCFKACTQLEESCSKSADSVMTIVDFDERKRKNGACIAGPMGVIPPVDRMVSSLIVHPSDGFRDTSFAPRMEFMDFDMVIVRTRNFLNVIATSQQEKFNDGPKMNSMYRHMTPMIAQNTLTVGYMSVMLEKIDENNQIMKTTKESSESALDIIMARASFDRDTHYGRHKGAPQRKAGLFRMCTKLQTVTGQSLLHPIARHAPANDCIRLGLPDQPRPPARAPPASRGWGR